MTRQAAWALVVGLVVEGSGAGEADAQVVRGVIPPPPQPAGPGVDLNRLTHELEDRVRHLAEDVQSDMGGTSEGRRLLRAIEAMANEVGSLHATLHDRPDLRSVARAYASTDATWHDVVERLRRLGATPAVQRAAARVDEVDGQLHLALGIPAFERARRVVLRPVFDVAPILVQVDQLIGRTDEFLNFFGPTVRVVPEGEAFLVEARNLRAAALAFREDASAGLPPDELLARYSGVDQWAQRLRGRVERISRGRTGPNIEALRAISDVSQLIANDLVVAAGGGVAPGLMQYGRP